MIYGDKQTQQSARIIVMGVAVIVILLLARYATSAEPQPTLASPHAAVASVVNFIGYDAESPSGSGTLVHVAGEKGYVLTADHIFHRTRKTGRGDEEVYAGRNVGRPVCAFPNGHVSYGRLLSYDQAKDLALIELERAPLKVDPVKLVVFKPDDQPLTVIGYPYGCRGVQKWTRMGFRRWRSNRDLLGSTVIDNGYSGGALCNRFGEQVGVVSGNAAGSESIYTAGPELVSFVQKGVPQ